MINIKILENFKNEAVRVDRLTKTLSIQTPSQVQAWMPESDGNPMAESDTVRQLKFLKTRVRQVIWSMSLSGIHICTE